MAPTICCRDVPTKLHRRQKQIPIAVDAEEVMATTTGSGGGMSVASGRTRASSATGKNQRNPAVRKNSAIVRRRRRRGVAWSLHEIEDSRISTTTAEDSGTMVSKYRRHHHSQGDGDDTGSDDAMETSMESRVERLSEDALEGHQQTQKKRQQGGRSTLLGITMRTVELIRRNQLLQWRLSLLQEETRAFVKSVMSNPENRKVEGGDKGKGGSSLEDGAQDPAVSGSC